MGLNVITRHPNNPIVTGEQFPVPLEGAYNSGCVKLKDGSYAMAARVNYYNQRTTVWFLDSKDGVHFEARSEPMALPQTTEFQKYADSVVYDPRMTRIEDSDEILMTLACHGSLGCRIGTFRSTDETKTWEFVDYQGIPDHRNTVYFPKKINGMYAVLDRPNVSSSNGGGNGGIWIKYSPDLCFWGKAERIIGPDAFMNHGAGGIGAGAPPIYSDKGWICITHAVMPAAKTLIYTAGCVVLDLEDPRKVIAVAKDPVLVPETLHELVGLVPSVVFPCGAVLEDNGEVKVYYGGADRVTCLGITSVDRLLKACE